MTADEFSALPKGTVIYRYPWNQERRVLEEAKITGRVITNSYEQFRNARIYWTAPAPIPNSLAHAIPTGRYTVGRLTTRPSSSAHAREHRNEYAGP